MKKSHRQLLDRVNRLTLYVFAGAGIAAAVAGTLNVRWVTDNQVSHYSVYTVSPAGLLANGIQLDRWPS